MVYFCVASTKIYLYLWLSEKLVAKQLICGTIYHPFSDCGACHLCLPHHLWYSVVYTGGHCTKMNASHCIAMRNFNDVLSCCQRYIREFLFLQYTPGVGEVELLSNRTAVRKPLQLVT